MPKVKFGEFWKPEACGQTVLPDKSVLIGQKLVENAKIKNSDGTIWMIFKQCDSDLFDFFSLFAWRKNPNVTQKF